MSNFFPSLDHITLDDAQNVYEPSDDTFLLCDALEADKSHLLKIQPVIAMEIGYIHLFIFDFFKNILNKKFLIYH
jgi:release factor glutamine methyltransferase